MYSTPRSDVQPHEAVRDSRFVELGSYSNESAARVEADRVSLCVKAHHAAPFSACDRQKRPQNSGPDPAAPPAPQHSHPTDVAVGFQSSGSDRHAICVRRKDVNRTVVLVVPLQLVRYALFLHENDTANRLKIDAPLKPRDTLDCE